MNKRHKRRSFSPDVVCSNLFLGLARSTQATYYNLCMHADDWGFIDSPRRLLAYLETPTKELKALLDVKLLHEFPSGAVVVMDWQINNSIRTDRLDKTDCQKELDQLICERGKRYQLRNQNQTPAPASGTDGKVAAASVPVHPAAQSAAAAPPRGGAKQRPAGNASGQAGSPASAPAAARQAPSAPPQVDKAQRSSGALGQAVAPQTNAQQAVPVPPQGQMNRNPGESTVASPRRQPPQQSVTTGQTGSSTIPPNRQQNVGPGGKMQVVDTSPDDPKHIARLTQIMAQAGVKPADSNAVMQIPGVRNLSENQMQFSCDYAKGQDAKNFADWLRHALLDPQFIKFVRDNAPKK